MRSGIIAKKVGMTRLFMDNGKQIPVTVLHMENLQVVAQRTNEAFIFTLYRYINHTGGYKCTKLLEKVQNITFRLCQ